MSNPVWSVASPFATPAATRRTSSMALLAPADTRRILQSLRAHHMISRSGIGAMMTSKTPGPMLQKVGYKLQAMKHEPSTSGTTSTSIADVGAGRDLWSRNSRATLLRIAHSLDVSLVQFWNLVQVLEAKEAKDVTSATNSYR